MGYTKIRIMGKPDEVKAMAEVIAKALDEHHFDSKVSAPYSNRGDKGDVRVYINTTEEKHV